METSVCIVSIVLAWMTLMSLVLAILPEKRANRIKVFVKMCLSALPLSAFARAFAARKGEVNDSEPPPPRK